MTEELLTIGQLATRCGVAASTLRYYEELGLVLPRLRSAGRRRYGPEAAASVSVIVFLRQVGFTLAEIHTLLTAPAGAWRELATSKLGELEAQISRAQAARHAIEHSLQCPEPDILSCPNFRMTVERVADGQSVAEAHAT